MAVANTMANLPGDDSHQTSLLTTKLYIPQTRLTGIVARPHLVQRLNENLDCRLTLIAAPAGFGKTTLVSNWLLEIGEPRSGSVQMPQSPITNNQSPGAAWLSLDESDPPAGYAYAGLGQLLYERNDLDAAEGHLSQAVKLGELMADWSMMRRGLLPLAWLRQIQGEGAEAQALWQRALNVVQRAESKRVEAQLMMHQILALQALAHAVLGDGEAGLDRLGEALNLAAPEGYVRIFIDYGPPMQGLLQQAAARGLAADYVSKLLAAFSAEEPAETPFPPPPGTPAPQRLVEPLTERELTILRLMAANLSHREIAEELHLSVNTIKWYSTHIYSKLGVHRRADAVACAQELGML